MFKTVSKRSIIACAVLVALTSSAFGLSLEITTGSGTNEGIRNVDGSWVKDGSLIQVIKVVGENDTARKILLEVSSVGYNFPFDPGQGKFDDQFPVSAGDSVFVRAFDAPYPEEAKWFGDSEIYTVKGEIGEYWNINGNGDIPAIVLSRSVK